MLKFKILICIVIFIFSCSICPAQVINPEQEAQILRVEFNRLGSSGDPVERENILKQIISKYPNTDGAQLAYWNLADLYLNAFDDEKLNDAVNILETFLKNYPNSEWRLNFELRLFEMYDNKNTRKEQLKQKILNEKYLPAMLKAQLN